MSTPSASTASNPVPIRTTLIDITNCIGCRACQVACKQWNELGMEPPEWTGTYQNQAHFTDQTFRLVRFIEEPKLSERVAARTMRRGEIRRQRQRFFGIRQCLLKQSLLRQRDGTVVVGIGIIGPQRYGSGVTRNCRIELLKFPLRAAAVVVCLGVIGRKACSFVKTDEGLRKSLEFHQRIAAIEV